MRVIMHPNAMAERLTSEYVEYLRILIGRLDNLCRSHLVGQELYYALLALHLDDPEGPMCKLAGTYQGAVLCCNCPLGPQPSGCMVVLYPIFNKLLSGGTKPARIEINNFIYRTNIAIDIYEKTVQPK